MTCSNSSGIVNIVNQQINLTIVDCKLTGSNLIESNYNGYITSTIVLVPLSVFINNFFVCVSNISSSGNQSIQIQFNAILQCDLCGGSSVVYGVCQDTLIHGQHVYGMLQCVHPFIFSNNQCICDQGYVLDQLNCVNIIQAMHNISISVNNGLSQRVVNIENAIQEQDIRISQNISQIQSELYSTLSVLENYIISNFSQSQDNLQVNLATIDKQIFENVTLLSNNIYSNQLTLQNYILQNSTILDWRIYNNISALKYNSTLEINDFKLSQYEILSDFKNQQQLQINQMQDTITNLIQQIDCTNLAGQFINGSCVYNICPVQGQKLINGVCQCVNTNAIIQNNVCACPKYSTLIGFICTCPDNSSLVSGVCTCLVAGQTINSGECSCSSGQSVIDGSCQTVVIINGSDSSFQCSQSVQVTTFDIQTVTNQLSTPLSFSQYQIFATSNIIIDAFIDISDQVYSTVNPLFQSQNSFNNIKIQIGTQIITGGSILVPNTTLTIKINQLNIISKIGSQITVSSYIYILLSSSQSTDIKTLLVNLSFAMSSGNITLINIVSGIINITGYQVVGNYQSTNQVSMIALTVNSVIGDISHVNFRPTIYNVGNCSSYIFSTLSSAEFTLTSVAILIGNSSSVQVLTSISSSSSNQYLFGGIFAKILGSSKIIIHNVISDCIQQISTSYTQYFGFLVGYGQSSSGSITVVNLCNQQIVINSQSLNCFGLIGQTLTNTSFQKAIVTFSVQGTSLNSVGLIGMQQLGSIFTEVLNVRIQMNIDSSSGGCVGALFGYLTVANGLINNMSVVSSKINSYSHVSGLVGYSSQTVVAVQNYSLMQSNITGVDCVGGFIGYSQVSVFKIDSSKIQQVRFIGTSNVAIIIGRSNSNTFTLQTSLSTTNLINNAAQQDCTSLTNSNTQIGC
ncbi:Conserved_hypothetical protein [Hexamita inflata]|uniref:Uncharacterized protein n=1 Tax=Hexamita inflata TaxID=28002 RepID=A0ABP1J6Q0_9EUKA